MLNQPLNKVRRESKNEILKQDTYKEPYKSSAEIESELKLVS